MNKKYLPSALILYLNYFIHGIGCSILSQQVVKEMLADQWGMNDAMKVTAIAAALGLGRLISLPFAGPLSDKLGRRISVLIGVASYVIFFVGIAFSPNVQGCIYCSSSRRYRKLLLRYSYISGSCRDYVQVYRYCDNGN